MKNAFFITLCLSIFCFTALSKSSEHKYASTYTATKTVTITGCIGEGVECFVLLPLRGNQSYSISKSSNLDVGKAYKITGSLSEAATCQQGFPIIIPKKIKKVTGLCRQVTPERNDEDPKKHPIEEPKKSHP